MSYLCLFFLAQKNICAFFDLNKTNSVLVVTVVVRRLSSCVFPLSLLAVFPPQGGVFFSPCSRIIPSVTKPAKKSNAIFNMSMCKRFWLKTAARNRVFSTCPGRYLPDHPGLSDHPDQRPAHLYR